MGGGPSLQALPAHPDGTTMKAVVIKKFGDADKVIEFADVPKPVPSADEILIKVHASAVNPVDNYRITGKLNNLTKEKYTTMVQCFDAAGVVTQVGANVQEFKVGDEVFTTIDKKKGRGTLAEFLAEEPKFVAPKPANINFEEAASFPLVAETALQCLRRGGVKEGSSVFVTGGATSVGAAAIQIAKILGASKIGTTASGERQELARKLGADVVVDYRTQDFGDGSHGKDYDFGFDTVHESAKLPGIVKKGGKVVTISDTPTVAELDRLGRKVGFAVRTFLNMNRNKEALANAEKFGVEWTYQFLEPNAEDLRLISGWISEGRLVPTIHKIWPMKDTLLAMHDCFSGKAKGKCVIRIVDNDNANAPPAQQEAPKEPAAEEKKD